MHNEILKKAIQDAITEDIGDGDHTSLSCIPKEANGKAQLLVKQNGYIAGLEIAKIIFEFIDPELKFNLFLKDGQEIKIGNIAFTVEGSVQSILKSERLVLNILQRMSGIATQTREYVNMIKGTKAQILDTRKTTPNFRYFEKLAVKIGGGTNHRMGLYDMIMLKDNHIDFAGGIDNAIKRTNEYLKEKNKDLKIEIEVRSISDIKKVMEIGEVDRIMFDNFSPELTKEAVKLVNNKIETESSGGITLKNVADYAKAGVDFISIGALTHQIKSLDLSLKAIDF
jgi:nicotinate-nucleotide pyrophosphorylase (carboxylating)